MVYSNWLKQVSAMIVLCVTCSVSWAGSYEGPTGEDTILIEKEVSTKIPYHKIAKSFIKHFFKVDAQNLLAFGKGRTDSVIRSFNDLGERTKYRFKVKEDEVEIKMTLNF